MLDCSTDTDNTGPGSSNRPGPGHLVGGRMEVEVDPCRSSLQWLLLLEFHFGLVGVCTVAVSPTVTFGTPILLLPIDDLDLTLSSLGWIRTFGLGVGLARATTVLPRGTSWRSSICLSTMACGSRDLAQNPPLVELFWVMPSGLM